MIVGRTTTPTTTSGDGVDHASESIKVLEKHLKDLPNIPCFADTRAHMEGKIAQMKRTIRQPPLWGHMA
eukprot:8252619-Karenia_brevis.AAC.1